jgi:hypothetical protein
MDATGREWVVVPKRPGALLVAPGEVAERDDVDEFLDDLFGEPTSNRPGTADVVLVVAGGAGVLAGLVGWPGSWGGRSASGREPPGSRSGTAASRCGWRCTCVTHRHV